MYAWEEVFEEKIINQRVSEAVHIKESLKWKEVSKSFSFSSGIWSI